MALLGDANEIAEARRTLERHGLQVTDVASPLFKVDWKGAPRSKFSPKGDQFSANYTFDQQGKAARDAAGWHACLDLLGYELDGKEPPWTSGERWQAVGQRLTEAVPFGHKLALTDIAAGQQIIEYGQPVGIAIKDIRQGDHVHVHNVRSARL